MPKSWTQQQEDASRLPEDLKRVAYDADSSQYFFRDRKGILYSSEPGSEYGKLTPIHTGGISTSRPNAFAPGKLDRKPTNGQHDHEPSPPSTFQDILPPSLITTSSLSKDSENNTPPGLRNQHNRLKDLVQKATLPKMHSVVERAKRSFLAQEKSASTTVEIDRECQGLIRQGSNVGTLYRTDTTTSKNSICSAELRQTTLEDL